MRLGVPYARKTLLAACLGKVFASSTLAELWRHSKLVAATAHELAGKCGYDQETAYIAGLLHDIGRLVTSRSAAELQADESDRLAAGFPLCYAETLVYGADHATLGGDLLQRWGLPSEIVNAVVFHHRPESTDSVLAAILHLCESECLTSSQASENLSTQNAACRRYSGGRYRWLFASTDRPEIENFCSRQLILFIAKRERRIARHSVAGLVLGGPTRRTAVDFALCRDHELIFDLVAEFRIHCLRTTHGRFPGDMV